MSAPASGDVVRAAGGILRRNVDGLQIAVVHRLRHDGDWTLPKGHVESDETWEQAAIREVREETGCEGRVLGVAEPIAYLVEGVPKVVLFFHMELVREGPLPSEDEVKEVVWLTPLDATERITYQREADVVARAFPAPRSANRWRRSRLGVRAERLRTTISVDEKLIRARVGRTRPGLPSDSGIDWGLEDWGLEALDFVAQAQAALVAGHVDEGWRCLNAASRLTIFGMEPAERALESARLTEEARVKLDGWRLKAVEKALSPVGNDPDLPASPPGPTELYFARDLVDDHFDTVYLRLGMLERRLVRLPLLLGVVLLGLLALVSFELPNAGGDTTLGSWRRLTTIVVLGALGAVISATLAGLRDPLRGQLTEIMQRDAIILLRPLVGATSAVAVAILFESGVQTAIDVAGPRIYPFALAAGFTERLITRVMESVENAATKT